MNECNRRDFLEFVGRSTASLGVIGLAACAKTEILKPQMVNGNKVKQITEDLSGASSADDLLTVAGVGWYPLISWGEIIAHHKGEDEKFGFNNDYIAYVPLNGSEEGILWVNHENPNPLFLHGVLDPKKKTQDNILTEKKSVGGSLLHIKKNNQGQYELVKSSQYNRRLSGSTHIPFDRKGKLFGKDYAVGTLANCAGGVTPWGTILSCEENYDLFYGEWDFEKKKRIPSEYGWEKFFDYSPLHYGWVVEVNPHTGDAIKRVSLGRFAHECATVRVAKDGRPVVYMGDDTNDQFIYKFIASEKNSLEHGTLYVANTEKGEWISLDYEKSDVLKKHFEGPVEVLIRTREAAKLLGATPQNRPEDIEIDPVSGNVFISCTNNKPRGDYMGAILKLEEDNSDPQSLTFKSSIFLAGGEATGFACPDNLVFDKKGNLWMTTDMSDMNQGMYKRFANNGLFFIPMSGPNAGKAVQVASAPVDAEFTGPCFSPDGKTLFLSVQHPGETSKDIFNLTSRWPSYSDGGIPRPTVVCLYGPYFNKLSANA